MTEVSGFQGSRTSGVDVHIYTQGGDPILKNQPAHLNFSGRENQSDARPSVVSVDTSKNMGAAAGTFTVVVKAPDAMGNAIPDLASQIVDDDWIDIIVNINGRKTHVLRGQIDNIRWQRQTGENGARSRSYTITGKDFGGILEKTYAWFNDFTQENYLGEKTRAIWGPQQTDAPFVIVDPVVAVRQAIFGFLETLTGLGHPDWRLPPSMPGVPSSVFRSFPDVAKYVATVDPDPARFAYSNNFVNPSGASIFQFAQQMSDPMFTELFCDLGDAQAEGAPLDPNMEMQADAVQNAPTMSVFYRDKPFPSVLTGLSGPWFRLPTTDVSPYAITSSDLGRGGAERINAIMVAPLINNEFIKKVLTSPLWDRESIVTHGMRQMSIESQYRAQEEKNYGITREQRIRVANWHALNAYFLSGTIGLGALFPAIRIGSRLRIREGHQQKQQETYYVEQVSHSWRAGGGKTTLGVTRGWVGTDQSLLTAVAVASDRFVSLNIPDEVK